jgi:hypothetical protein
VPTGLILAPLLVGYLFLHICFWFRFRTQRQDGYRLLIESVIAGIPLVFLGHVASSLIHDRGLDPWQIEATCRRMGIPFLGTGLMSGALALGLALIVNLVSPSMWSKWRLIKSHDNGFLRLAHEAAMEEKPVAVTLKNRKVYIGMVIRTPSLKVGAQYITVLPITSGYRDPITLRLVVTEDYATVYRQANIDASDFGVTIPLDEIESASLFNPEVYPLFLSRPATSGPPNDDPARLPAPTVSTTP